MQAARMNGYEMIRGEILMEGAKGGGEVDGASPSSRHPSAAEAKTAKDKAEGTGEVGVGGIEDSTERAVGGCERRTP